MPCNPVGEIVVHVADVKPQAGGLLMTLAFVSVSGSDQDITGIRLQSGERCCCAANSTQTALAAPVLFWFLLYRGLWSACLP